MKLNHTQKLMNSMFLLLMLISTLFSWFGGARGVQEIKGITFLTHPVMLIFIIIVCISLFSSNHKVRYTLAAIGFGGIVCVEVYHALTWYILTITGEFSLSDSFEWTYPEFYFALLVPCLACLFNVIQLLKTKVK